MRARYLVAILMLTVTTPAFADPPKVAVFDLELVDTSLQGEVDGPRNDEHDRLMRVSDQLRERDRDVIVAVRARGSNLQACGGCDVQYAQKLGADVAVTGVVQKVSNLILNISIYLRDVRSGQLITAMSADMRGNTDESWSRAMSYLVRNRLLAPNYGRPQAQ